MSFLPRVRLPEGRWVPFAIVGGTILATHWVDTRLATLEAMRETWTAPIAPGTPMRQVLQPAAAWALGVGPVPVPAEMHALAGETA